MEKDLELEVKCDSVSYSKPTYVDSRRPSFLLLYLNPKIYEIEAFNSFFYNLST